MLRRLDLGVIAICVFELTNLCPSMVVMGPRRVADWGITAEADDGVWRGRT
jgi:hypothetical protein